MPNIHDIFKDEDVRGVVIGGDYVTARLEYDGRQQGGQICADNHETAKSIATVMKDNYKKELGFLFNEIYPNDKAWRIVFYN